MNYRHHEKAAIEALLKASKAIADGHLVTAHSLADDAQLHINLMRTAPQSTAAK
jgi:hypothetical protein